MDPSRDNPLLRFATFWWALGTFLIFALLLALIMTFYSTGPVSLEDAPAKVRYETRAKMEKSQIDFLNDEAIHTATSNLSKSLFSAKAVAVESPAQVILGSATAKKLAQAPAADTKAMDVANSGGDTLIDTAQLAAGKAQFLICGACHGQNGEGSAIAPPLAGSEWVKGPISNLIRIQLRGLQGPINVAGKEYNIPGGMAALSYQTDEQIAAVLTYVRNSFGNKGSAVKPEQVVSLRSEIGKPQLTEAELTKP